MNSRKSRKFVSIDTVAREIGVSPATIREWCDDGHIHFSVLPSGHRRFIMDDVVKDLKMMGWKKVKRKEKYCEKCERFWSISEINLDSKTTLLGLMRTNMTTGNPDNIPRELCPFCGDYTLKEALMKNNQLEMI